MFKQLIFYIALSLGLQGVFAQNILGIDVSHWQGTIDWTLVGNDGYVFSWVKATEGMTYTDPKFFTNIEDGITAGLIMGAYHFARPDNNSAQQDATNFLNNAADYIGTGFLPPVLDLENPYSNGQAILLTEMFTSEELSLWVQEWMNEVESETGVVPYLYINANYAAYLSSSLNTYGLWFAQPDQNLDPPSNIGPWEDYGFKQYSWWGDVSGITGDVDLNVFNGSAEELDVLIGLNNTSEIKEFDKQIKIYPNPTSDWLYLSSDLNIASAILYDAKGIKQEVFRTNDRIDCATLKSGVYYLKIKNEQGLVFRYKVFRI